MPELPEVETVVRGLEADLIGRCFTSAHVSWFKVISGWDAEDFQRSLKGRRITTLSRRGKYICIHLDNSHYLVVHLRMTGRLYLCDDEAGADAWVRLSLGLDNGRYLAFSDARKFGRVELCPDLSGLEAKLGPEPLELEPEAYKNIFVKSSRAIKVFLLDQKQLAGVGNIYADEALFESGIHPRRPVNKLTDAERVRLGDKVRTVLERGINHEGASISWYRKPDGSEGESQVHFLVYGRGSKDCYRCGGPISKIVLGQRGTHFCNVCQK